MSRFAQAPLVEVVFELRWGAVEKRGSEVDFTFPESDVRFFAGQFHKVATEQGFPIHEVLQHQLNMVPHAVVDRYRPGVGEWPCLQTGLGIFTVNQLNDGYDWKPFRESVLEGLAILDKGHPDGLSGIVPRYVELRYIDGLIFGDGEKPLVFMRDKLELSFDIPKKLLESTRVTPQPRHIALAYGLPSSSPAGVIHLDIKEAQINGRPGFAATTTVRSAGSDCPKLSHIEAWLEEAHALQLESFHALVNEAYKETLG